MRKMLTNPFTNSYPKIDVHGETRDTVNVIVKDFINDNIKLKNKHIIIIHGIGEGILKKTIHAYLKTDNRIADYKLESSNPGSTIITLKID